MKIDEFTVVLSDNESPGSHELGGAEVILELASNFVESSYADRMAGVLRRMGESAQSDYLCFAVDVLRRNPFPLVVAAVGQNLAESGISRHDAMTAQDVLLSRAHETSTHLANEMASECMAVAFLLASEVKASKPALIAALERVEPGDESLLVRRAALLAGLAWLWDRSKDVEETLERLAEDPDAGEQAAFELGMIHVDYALSSQDQDSLFARLRDAAKWFATAESIDPDMLEATAFRGALQGLLLFCDHAPATDVEEQLTQAREAASERFHYLDTLSMRKWLRPRLDLQTTWYKLSCALEGLSAQMSQRSWLRALPVLQKIAGLRSTIVSLATKSGDTLREAVTCRLASGFVATEGLRTHLRDWADDTETDDWSRQHALGMLAAVEKMRADQGKAPPLASEDGLVSGARPDADLERQNPSLPDPRVFSPLNTAQEECFARIVSELRQHADFRGSVEADVKLFSIFLIRFLTYCLNVGHDISTRGFSFLFQNSDDELPLEKQLQSAMFEWLHISFSGFKNHQVLREVPDFAKGRTDIAIVLADWTLVAELKREISDASRNGLAKYLGQAAAYVLAGPRISFLVVVDLCLQKKWGLTLADNCWVETVQTENDSVPRMVIVFRIPGMLPLPSNVVTPSNEPKADEQDASAKRGRGKSKGKPAMSGDEAIERESKPKVARPRVKAASTRS
jgi:hypothetical protein